MDPKFWRISLYLGLGVFFFDMAALPQEEHRSAVPFIEYLGQIGPKLGCHFSIESRDSTAGKPWKILHLVTNDLSLRSVPQLLSKLRRDLEGFSVEQDSKDPKTIHIIEGGLEGDSQYPLNKKIDLKYRGNIQEQPVWNSKRGYFERGGGLIGAASKEAPGVYDATEQSGNWAGFGDYITKVDINCTNQTLRSILSDCLPRTNYSPVLWEAVTIEEAGKVRVWVLFSGPRKQ